MTIVGVSSLCLQSGRTAHKDRARSLCIHAKGVPPLIPPEAADAADRALPNVYSSLVLTLDASLGFGGYLWAFRDKLRFKLFLVHLREAPLSRLSGGGWEFFTLSKKVGVEEGEMVRRLRTNLSPSLSDLRSKLLSTRPATLQAK